MVGIWWPVPWCKALAQAEKTLQLNKLRNVGKATLKDFQLLGITSVEQLAQADALDLYRQLSLLTGTRQDSCVEDVFAATIHQARTGEALDWWAFTPARKLRDKSS